MCCGAYGGGSLVAGLLGFMSMPFLTRVHSEVRAVAWSHVFLAAQHGYNVHLVITIIIIVFFFYFYKRTTIIIIIIISIIIIILFFDCVAAANAQNTVMEMPFTECVGGS